MVANSKWGKEGRKINHPKLYGDIRSQKCLNLKTQQPDLYHLLQNPSSLTWKITRVNQQEDLILPKAIHQATNTVSTLNKPGQRRWNKFTPTPKVAVGEPTQDKVPLVKGKEFNSNTKVIEITKVREAVGVKDKRTMHHHDHQHRVIVGLMVYVTIY